MLSHLNEKPLAAADRHFRSVLPSEGCGAFIADKSTGAIIRFVPMANVAPDAENTFVISPEEWINLLYSVNPAAGGETVAGIAHSHPAGPPVPSEKDQAAWHYPGLLYWIFSYADPLNCKIGVFRTEPNGTAPVRLQPSAFSSNESPLR